MLTLLKVCGKCSIKSYLCCLRMCPLYLCELCILSVWLCSCVAVSTVAAMCVTISVWWPVTVSSQSVITCVVSPYIFVTGRRYFWDLQQCHCGYNIRKILNGNQSIIPPIKSLYKSLCKWVANLLLFDKFIFLEGREDLRYIPNETYLYGMINVVQLVVAGVECVRSPFLSRLVISSF